MGSFLVMSSSNGKHIHTNVLQPSSSDMVSLGRALHERFLDLCSTHFRVNKVQLLPPKYLDKDMILWRSMMVRHYKGDFRNTEDEKKAIRRIAEWTLKENCLLKGQEYVPLEWED